MSCLGDPQLGSGESFSTQEEGPFSFSRQVPSPSQQRRTALGTGGSSALCLSRHDRVSYASTPVNELGQAG